MKFAYVLRCGGIAAYSARTESARLPFALSSAKRVSKGRWANFNSLLGLITNETQPTLLERCNYPARAPQGRSPPLQKGEQGGFKAVVGTWTADKSPLAPLFQRGEAHWPFQPQLSFVGNQDLDSGSQDAGRSIVIARLADPHDLASLVRYAIRSGLIGAE